MIGRPAHDARWGEPGMLPVMTKNVAGKRRSLSSGMPMRNWFTEESSKVSETQACLPSCHLVISVRGSSCATSAKDTSNATVIAVFITSSMYFIESHPTAFKRNADRGSLSFVIPRLVLDGGGT